MAGAEQYFTNLPRTATITVRVTTTQVLLLSDGRVITAMSRTEAALRLRLPGRVPPALQTANKWLGHVGAALSFASSAYEQWLQDEGLDTSYRVLRAGTRGGLVTAGGVGGAMLGGFGAGALSGTVCGPGAPVCSGVLGFSGALIGAVGFAFLGDKIADILPWMDAPEPKPGEYDLDALSDEIAQEDGALSRELAGVRSEVRSVADDLALASTADDPELQGVVDDITRPLFELPDFPADLGPLDDYVPQPRREPGDLRPLTPDAAAASPVGQSGQ